MRKPRDCRFWLAEELYRIPCLAPPVEKDNNGIDQEEKDEAKDNYILDMDVEVRSVDGNGWLCGSVLSSI